ncbi:hypothetical protein [Thalassospira povalilytica]|uniref:hypothetical protein n=1 Tax=Thalassospira povalilytica TaxID=732237 RepID=UPI003AA82DE0
MTKKYKIGLFIDHDIMIRHFLHSRVFEGIFKCHDVDVIVPPASNKRISLDPAPWVLNSRLVRLDANPVTHRLWARLMQVQAMRFNRSAPSMRKAWRLVQSWKSELLHTVLGFPGIFYFFQLYVRNFVKNNPNVELGDLINRQGYDVVLNAGIPNGIFVNDLIVECRKNEIPLLYIMNSWDNPSAGPFAAGRPDAFLAWGPQTAQHAREYQGFPQEDVYTIGAAQFEVYKTEPTVTRQEFCRTHVIPEHAKIILYAGGSLGTNEFEHLQLLEDAIERGKVENAVIVYRPHPWGGGGNAGDKIISHHWKHVRIESTMRDYLLSIKTRGYHLTFPSYIDTHNVLNAADVVISPLSTILIEAALHQKPIMCFLPLEDVSARHFQTVHNLPHFLDLQQDPNVVLAKGRNELISKLPHLLGRLEQRDFSEKISKTCEFFVSTHNKLYSDRVIEVVEKVLQKKKEI